MGLLTMGLLGVLEVTNDLSTCGVISHH